MAKSIKKIKSRMEKYKKFEDDIVGASIEFANKLDESKFEIESKASKNRRLRPRIEEMFDKDTRIKLYLNSVNYRIPDNNDRAQVVRDMLEPEFVHLGTGTNRITFLKDGYAVKIALDRRGLIDNMSEYKRSIEAPQFLAKAYETNRTILIAEYVNLIDKQEFLDNIDKLRYILSTLTQYYIIDDLGLTAKNYCNWGYRDDQSIVALDYAYMYPIEGNENAIMCSCGGKIVPDSNFTAYQCSSDSCKMKYSTMEIKSRLRMDKIDEDDAEIIEVMDNTSSEQKFIRVAGEQITEVSKEDVEKNSNYEGLELDDLVDKLFNTIVNENQLASNTSIADMIRGKLFELNVFDKLLEKYQTKDAKDIHFIIRDKANGKKSLTVRSITSDLLEEFETDDTVSINDMTAASMNDNKNSPLFTRIMNAMSLSDDNVNIINEEDQIESEKIIDEILNGNSEDLTIAQHEWEHMTSLYNAMKDSKDLLSSEDDE